MIQFTARDYSHEPAKEAAMQRDAVERRRRLMGPAKQPAAMLKILQGRSPPPLWKKEPTNFSAHVDDWCRHKIEMGNLPLQFLKKRAIEIGVEYEMMISPTRGKKPVWIARQRLIAEVRENFPRLSLPQLGRLFHRDHTSVLHALRKAEADRAADI